MSGWMMILWLAVLVAIAVGAWHMVTEIARRAYIGSDSGPTPEDIAQERLRRRYSEGGIKREQYIARLRELKRR